MRWRPEEETTEIIITGEKPRQDSLEKTPHIVCMLGAGRWAGIGLDQLLSSRVSKAERVHSDLMSMNMTYQCVAKEGLVARRIAWNASLYTNIFRRLLQRHGKLHHIGASHDISAESPPGALTGALASEELVSVVVTVPFHWQPQWLIRDPAEVLKSVKTNINVLRPSLAKPGQVVTTPAVESFEQVVISTSSVVPGNK